MTKLISSIVAIVLATATLATAAPRQGAVRKTGTAARAKAVKTSKPANRIARKKSGAGEVPEDGAPRREASDNRSTATRHGPSAGFHRKPS